MFKTGDIVGFQLKKDPEVYVGKVIRIDPTSGTDIVYYLQHGEKSVYTVKKSEMTSAEVITKEPVPSSEAVENTIDEVEEVTLELKPKKKRSKNKKLDTQAITV